MKRIAVALVLLVAAASAFYLLMQDKRSKEREEARSRKLITFDERAASGLDINVDGRAWSLSRRDDGSWFIDRPVQDPADGSLVVELLRLLNNTNIIQTIDSPEALSAYGLEPARAEIRIEGAGTPAVFLGNPTPAGSSVFMRVEGRPGVLVAEVAADSPFLNPDPHQLRDRNLPGMSIQDVERIRIVHGGNRVALVREGSDWWLSEPRRLPASTFAVNGVLETLANAEVVGFIDDQDPGDVRFGLGPVAFTVELQGRRRQVRLVLGAATDAGYRFAARDDRQAILAVYGEGLFDLKSETGDYLDEKLTKANRYRIRWFRYSRQGRVLEAERDTERERWIAPEGGELDDATVFPMLVALLEGALEGWSEGPMTSPAEAVLEYRQEDGTGDRVVYGPAGLAALDSIPGAVFRSQTRIPELP